MCCVCQEQESLKEVHLSPVREKNVELLQEILRDLDPFKHRSNTAAELASILTQPHFQVKNIQAKAECQVSVHSDLASLQQKEGIIRMTGIKVHVFKNKLTKLNLFVSLCWRPMIL